MASTATFTLSLSEPLPFPVTVDYFTSSDGTPTGGTAIDGEDYDMNLLSAFVVQRLNEKLSLVVRADRMFDPNPAGEAIAYLFPRARWTDQPVIASGDYKTR